MGCWNNAGEFVDMKCPALVCKEVAVTLDINNPAELLTKLCLFLWCEFVECFEVAWLIVSGDCVRHGVCVLDVSVVAPGVRLHRHVLELGHPSECFGELVGLGLCLTHPVRPGDVGAIWAGMVCPDVELGEHGWCSVLCVDVGEHLLIDGYMITTTVGPRQHLRVLTHQ